MSSKILVADDEKCILKLYTRIFSGKEYSITTAGSFKEASGLIEANHYDLLVTDLLFPDGLGTELIKLFEKKRAGAKSLLVTGSSDADELLENSGVTEYFYKPFEVRCFMAAVDKALKP
ncbi:MAG: response regulator [Elusimicrobiales bacterium]|jgi:DNA-binding NtrC family response regulator